MFGTGTCVDSCADPANCQLIEVIDKKIQMIVEDEITYDRLHGAEDS